MSQNGKLGGPAHCSSRRHPWSFFLGRSLRPDGISSCGPLKKSPFSSDERIPSALAVLGERVAVKASGLQWEAVTCL